MAALVHGAVEAHGKVVLIPASGDAHVAGADPRGEGMHGVVQPPRFGSETHHHQRLGDQLALVRHGGVRGEHLVVGHGPFSVEPSDEGDQRVGHLAEQRCDRLGPHLRLVVVQKHVIGALVPVVAKMAFDVAAGELEVALKRRRESSEVRVGARG